MSKRPALWVLGLSLAFGAGGPAPAQVPVIDRIILSSDANRDETTSKIEGTDNRRFSVNQSVTCAIYRPGHPGDAASSATANPEIAGLVKRIAREENVEESLFLALVYQESRFNPCAKSTAGAIGLAQLMPETARELGVDPYDIEENLSGGARYLKQQLQQFNGDRSLALAAYNAGPGRVQTYGGIPPFRETQGYVAAITQKWLPAFGGSNVSDIPANYGGGSIAYIGMRNATITSMATSRAISDSSGNVASWLGQLGEMPAGTLKDSWDHNAGARIANLEMMNQVIRLGATMTDLFHSRSAVKVSGLSGSSRSVDTEDGHESKDDPDTAGTCDPHQGLEWSSIARACVLPRQRSADIALMLNAQ
ncbi:lytic transglycosylase domain-containing protein [Rhizobium terrae]|uniref:lytic transglycosylase domain-containing protein n=1 Tax=Rhizobium terrae TaxID=2171756 RepID=UPI000E3D85C5|nr:lytic transglycosylase domain-containing protein [Rhizobium terrae]